MFFNSFEFIGFLILVLLILCGERLVGKNVRLRNVTLLIASYFFYGYFNIGFTLILAFVTLVNYVAGRMLFNRVDKHRKGIVTVSAVLSLLPLAFFKYSLFLCRGFATIMKVELDIEMLNGLLLPVGISFFTFQAMSYTIDVYRGKIKESAGLIDFFLFVAFFPTIMSGPIEKARNLLPQIGRFSFPTISDVTQGACIFIWGIFKKIVIADRLGYYVDWAYGGAEYRTGLTLAVAAVFYSIQIYCDFSGYSDMALGVAKTLGFDVTKNFRQPYFSRTIKEFWRKWHIALTSWFTEYVYFSLGGSRVKYKLCWIFNVSLIFVLSGIWHGAAWSFLIWGCLHAVYYLIEHFLGLQSDKIKWNKIKSVLYGTIVFVLVTLAWIFFRLEFDQALLVIERIFTAGGKLAYGSSNFTFVGTVAILCIFVTYELLVRKRVIWFDTSEYQPKLMANLVSVIPMLILMGMFGMSSANFVYFQF